MTDIGVCEQHETDKGIRLCEDHVIIMYANVKGVCWTIILKGL